MSPFQPRKSTRNSDGALAGCEALAQLCGKLVGPVVEDSFSGQRVLEGTMRNHGCSPPSAMLCRTGYGGRVRCPYRATERDKHEIANGALSDLEQRIAALGCLAKGNRLLQGGREKKGAGFGGRTMGVPRQELRRGQVRAKRLSLPWRSAQAPGAHQGASRLAGHRESRGIDPASCREAPSQLRVISSCLPW